MFTNLFLIGVGPNGYVTPLPFLTAEEMITGIPNPNGVEAYSPGPKEEVIEKRRRVTLLSVKCIYWDLTCFGFGRKRLLKKGHAPRGKELLQNILCISCLIPQLFHRMILVPSLLKWSKTYVIQVWFLLTVMSEMSNKELANYFTFLFYLPFTDQPLKRRKRHRRKQVKNQEPCLMRGVYYKNMKWQAAIKVEKRQIHLGTFSSQEEAARLYDR